MLDVAKSEDGELTDISNVIYDRVMAARAAKTGADSLAPSIAGEESADSAVTDTPEA